MDILITEDLQAPAIDALAAKFSVVREPLLWQDAAKLKAALADARTVMVRNQTQLTADVLAAAPELLGIGRVGVGLDNIALNAATERGITVIAPLDANAVSVAELTLGLLLALARKLPQADRSTKAGGWDRRACTGIPSRYLPRSAENCSTDTYRRRGSLRRAMSTMLSRSPRSWPRRSQGDAKRRKDLGTIHRARLAPSASFPSCFSLRPFHFGLRFQASVCSFSIGDGLELRQSPRIKCWPL